MQVNLTKHKPKEKIQERKAHPLKCMAAKSKRFLQGRDTQFAKYSLTDMQMPFTHALLMLTPLWGYSGEATSEKKVTGALLVAYPLKYKPRGHSVHFPLSVGENEPKAHTPVPLSANQEVQGRAESR